MNMNSNNCIQENDAGKYVLVDSANIDFCMNLFYEENCDGVILKPKHGFRSKDISFIKEHPSICKLKVLVPVNDISPIYTLRNVKELIIGYEQGAVDFHGFPELKKFTGDWNNKHILCKDSKLEEINFSGFKPKEKNLKELLTQVNLRSLTLIQTNIVSLVDISNLKELEKVSISYAPKLINVSELTKLNDLHYLEFDNCKNVNFYEIAKKLINLRHLMYHSSKSLPDIGFIDFIPNLEEFRFVDTNILDGNLEPCLKLKKVGFNNKRHYTHKAEEIRKAIGDDSLII